MFLQEFADHLLFLQDCDQTHAVIITYQRKLLLSENFCENLLVFLFSGKQFFVEVYPHVNFLQLTGVQMDNS